MRLLTFFFVILIISIINAQDIEVTTELEEVFREEYCSNSKSPKENKCFSYRCSKDNTKIIGVGCAEARCSGKPIGFKGDRSKPYPECCIVPICEDSKE